MLQFYHHAYLLFLIFNLFLLYLLGSILTASEMDYFFIIALQIN